MVGLTCSDTRSKGLEIGVRAANRNDGGDDDAKKGCGENAMMIVSRKGD